MDIQLSRCDIIFDIYIGVSINETHFYEIYLNLCINGCSNWRHNKKHRIKKEKHLIYTLHMSEDRNTSRRVIVNTPGGRDP